MSYSVIGKPHPRKDALLQMTGRAMYGDDIKRPGMLVARALRSEYAHARIKGIDTAAAQAMDGVHCVVTAADIPHNRYGFTHQDQPVLADDKVRCYGDPVAVVAADDERTANAALELIRVEYEPLPYVSDVLAAMREDSPLVHGGASNIVSHLKIRNGDMDEGWEQSDHIIEEKITTPMVEHAMIEPHATVAETDEEGNYTLWDSVQRPFTIAAHLGGTLQVPQHKIRVITTAIGGGFGGKNEITLEPALCVMAAKTGRPVKHVFTREDEFNASTMRHAYKMNYRTGLKNDGTLVARQVEIISDCGPYVTWGESTLTKALIHAAGPYRIPYTRVDAFLVYTNNPVGGAMRGFGVTQLGFAYEAHTDTIAAALGIDPVELRMKNMIEDGDTLTTGQQLGAVALKSTMRRALELAGWEERE